MSDLDQDQQFPSFLNAKSKWEQLASSENTSSTSLAAKPSSTLPSRPAPVQSMSFPSGQSDAKLKKVPPPTKPKPQRLTSKPSVKENGSTCTAGPELGSSSSSATTATTTTKSKSPNSSRPPTPPQSRLLSPGSKSPISTRSNSPSPQKPLVAPTPRSLHSRTPSALLSPEDYIHHHHLGSRDLTSPKPARPISPKPQLPYSNLAPLKPAPPRPRSPAPPLSRHIGNRVVSAGDATLSVPPRPPISRQASKTPPPSLQTTPSSPLSRQVETSSVAPPALPPRPGSDTHLPLSTPTPAPAPAPALPPRPTTEYSRSAELLPAIRLLPSSHDESTPVSMPQPIPQPSQPVPQISQSLPQPISHMSQSVPQPISQIQPIPQIQSQPISQPIPQSIPQIQPIPQSQPIPQPIAPLYPTQATALYDAPIIPDASIATPTDYDSDENNAGGYPDSSQVNRRPPLFEGVLHEISGKNDVRTICNLGVYFCVFSSGATNLYDADSGNIVWSASHSDTRITAAGFVTNDLIWMGSKEGCLYEVDVNRPGLGTKRANVHLQPVTAIRYCKSTNEIWSLSEDGKLAIWTSPSVSSTPKTFRVTPNFKAWACLDNKLWIGRNKQLFIYEPTTASLNVNPRPILAATLPTSSSTVNVVASNSSGISGSSIGLNGASPSSTAASVATNASVRQLGEFTCATAVTGVDNFMFFGHEDGTITVFCHSRMAAVANVNVSIHKVCSLSCGDVNHLWIGLKTGVILVCDVSQVPWKVLKEWKAHDGSVSTISCQSGPNCLPVMSFCAEDSSVCIWDGLLKHDWIEKDLHMHDSEFSKFRTLRTQVITWNAGAAKPADIDGQSAQRNSENLKRALHPHDNVPVDIVVFGFQELVELDNKSVTAKTMFQKRKKGQEKDVVTSSHISSQYRAWQDRLDKLVSDASNNDRYRLVHSNNMVGLFTCVFIRDAIMSRVHSVKSSVVKTGLGGLHGNKGGLVVRVLIDDSSLCFVNCHLAAGQSNILQRNADIETILQSQFLDPSENTNLTGKGIFANGGDGTMISDHEICFFSGDMNYRIAKLRNVAIKAIQDGALAELLDSDQLISQLKKNPGMRLRAFNESPITFAPTYKFDVGTDNYDTSEKKRVPAWCDRIFYRGGDRILPIEYKSIDVYVSDHKPVSGVYDVQVKTIDPSQRKEVYKRSLDRWRDYLRSKSDILAQ